MAAVRVDTHFIATQRQLHAERRRNRFEKEPPPPPPPPKRIAWPGGKISTNKMEALEAFAKRKEREGDAEAVRKARESLRKLREATDGSAIDSPSALSFETKTQRAEGKGTELQNRTAPRFSNDLQGSRLGPLDGLLFALSAGGDSMSQRDLSQLIVKAGGKISNTVHKRVDYVVASAQARRRNTQAVRKALGKFGIPLISPDELRHRIDEPTTPPAEPSTPAPTPTPTTTSTPRTSPTPTPPCVASSSPASPIASSPSPVGSGTGGLARIGGRKAQPTQGEVTGARPKTRSKPRLSAPFKQLLRRATAGVSATARNKRRVALWSLAHAPPMKYRTSAASLFICGARTWARGRDARLPSLGNVSH